MPDYLNIAGRVRTTAADGVVAEAQEVKDLLKNKSQQELNNDFSTAIEAILLLIPSAASSLNQLADKAFVNSSIATASATFRGTYNLVSDLNLTVSATHAQIGAALAGAVSDEDNNDYAFVQIPTSDATPTQIAKTERYKFNGTTWEYEYDLNNSGYTDDQWAAINSGITAALVSKLSALPTNAELTTALGLLSDGIAAINGKIPSEATTSNKLVDTAAMQSYVTQIINAIDATFNVGSADGHVAVQITQVNGVITSVAVTTSDIASAAALTLVTGRVTDAEANIVSLGGRMTTAEDDIDDLQQLYNNLQQSAPVVIEPTDTWPVAVADRSATVIYRVVDRVNTPPQYYSDYMFRASDLSGQPVLMAQYDNAIDPRPKKGSQNLVTSGGVFDNMGALDVSELNATENPHTLATYADLSAALAAIPSDYQKGGMSIKFIQGTAQSSDNKYVQFLCKSQTFTTNVADWEKMNLEEEVSKLGQKVDDNKSEIIDIQNSIQDTDGDTLYVTDIDGNVVAKIDANGLHTIDVETKKMKFSDFSSIVPGLYRKAFYVADGDGNVIASIDSKGIHAVNITENLWSGKTLSVYGDSVVAINNGDFEYPYSLQGTQLWANRVADFFHFKKQYGRGVGGQKYAWGNGGGSVTFINTVDGTYNSRNDSYNLDNYQGAVPAGCTAVRGCLSSWLRITTMFPASIKDTIDVIVIMSHNDSYDTTDCAFVANDTTDLEWAASGADYYGKIGGDYNINTLRGGIASTLMKLQMWMPNAIIVISTGISGSGVNGQLNPDINPAVLLNIEQAVRDMSKITAVPCIDSAATDGINGWNRTKYIADEIHPYTIDGSKMVARAIIGGLKTILPNI